MYLVSGWGITIGYHRLLTHRAFQTYKPLEYALAIARLDGGPGADDRLGRRSPKAPRQQRHRGRPHSPHVSHGSGLADLWHAHVGWLFDTNGQADRRKYAPDLMDDRGMRLLNRWFPALVALSLLVPFGVGLALTGAVVGGRGGAALGRLRADLLRPPHHLVDQLDLPLHGARRFAADDHSTNVWWLSLASLGEAWHHNHHAFPRSAFHGLRCGSSIRRAS